MDETDDFESYDDTVYKTMPISRHRMESFLIRVDEIGRDGEVLNTTRRFEGVDSPQDVARIIEAYQLVPQEIFSALLECLKYPESAAEILQFMHEVKDFHEGKAAYVPQPKPEIISRKVKKTTIERPPMIIFDDDE